MENKIYFLYEYMEDTLSDWTISELQQIIKYLSLNKNNILFITNLQIVDMKTQKKEILNQFKEIQNNDIVITDTKKLKDVFKNNKFIFKDITFNKDEICLLDMRGKEILQTGDKKLFKAFVFGGILGDHPPKDRTSQLRQNFLHFRNLQTTQMSTDTAVLVSDMILNGMKFEDIPLIYNPEFQNPEDKHNSVQLEGFVYVSDQYNWKNREMGKVKGKPIISDKIGKDLLFAEFDEFFSQF